MVLTNIESSAPDDSGKQSTSSPPDMNNVMRLMSQVFKQTPLAGSFPQGPGNPATILKNILRTVTERGESTDASTQTSPTQTGPIPSVSNTELWERQLKFIRRSKPIVPNDCPVTVFRCQLREIKKPELIPTVTAQPSRNPFHLSQSSAPSVSRKIGAPVVNFISISSGDEDEHHHGSNNADKEHLKSDNLGSLRVGGAGQQLQVSGYRHHDYDHDGKILPPPPLAPEWERRQERERRMEEFYGLERGEAYQCQGPHDVLRFQDNRDSYGARPGPRTGHQLRLEEYHDEIGSTHRRGVERPIADILKFTSWGAVADGADGPEATEARWRAGRGSRVVAGFPLVEGVRFLVAGNHGEPAGDCYWRALSIHLYGGSDAHWDLVKAEHLAFVYHVLTNPRHPRNGLYGGELNARFFETSSVEAQARGAGGERRREGGRPFRANLWQVLHLAHAWTPALMQQVTADLYGVCLVTFSAGRRADGAREVTETTVRGAYNSRHLFLLFADGCHFQPMIPADYHASEFQYPRPTPADTARYRFAPRALSDAARDRPALEHAWRREFTSSAPLPVPRLHGCDVDTLRRYMGSQPRS